MYFKHACIGLPLPNPQDPFTGLCTFRCCFGTSHLQNVDLLKVFVLLTFQGTPSCDQVCCYCSPPEAQGGPWRFSGLREIHVKPFLGRVWREIGAPKRLLGTVQKIPTHKILRQLVETEPSTKAYLPPPLSVLGPERGPEPSGTQTLT